MISALGSEYLVYVNIGGGGDILARLTDAGSVREQQAVGIDCARSNLFVFDENGDRITQRG
jgi:hypothetical protein